MHYFIFPEKDTTIYQMSGSKNTGLDEILEIRKDLNASGKNPKTGLVEIIELSDHPWFIGTQFHPEYKSTVINPHPLFVSFVGASVKNKKQN